MKPRKTQGFIFTEKRLREILPVSECARQQYFDEECKGLILRVSRSTKSFIFRHRGAYVTLGTWPIMSVENARKAVRERVAPDPEAAQKAKRTKREAETLGESWADLLDNPMRRDGRGLLREKTLKGYKTSWERLKHWTSRRHEEITGKDVRNLRDAVHKAHGPALACQTMALLCVLLGRKMPREDNGRAIGKPTPEPRRRYLNASELGAILRGLDAEAHLWRVFWLCAILVPLRRGNIAGARWADVHLDGSPRWEVSATNAKGRKLLTPPIPEALAPILRDWQAKNPGQEYVFPAGLTGSPVRAGYKGPVVNVQHAWTRAVQFGEAVRICDAIAQAEGKTGRERFAIFLRDLEAIRFESWRIARDRRTIERDGKPLARALVQLRAQAKALGIDPAPLAITDVCPHDLRRTAASWAVQAGASLSVVAASLGHADTRITEQHYGHLSDDPVRKMQNENAGRVLASMGRKSEAEIEAEEDAEDRRLAREALADYNSGKDPGVPWEEVKAKMAAKHAKATK